MQSAAIPENEQSRLAALNEYQILNFENGKELDDIRVLASEICQAPISLITLIDGDSQWYISGNIADQKSISRALAICSHAILTPDLPLVIPDLRNDERFSDHPFVSGDPNLVFYAGFPLTNGNGYALGTIAIMDFKPKSLSASQIRSLNILAKQVMHILELKKTHIKLEDLKKDLESRNEELQQFAYVVSHDIKSPLASIVLTSEMLKEQFEEEMTKDTDQLLKVLNRSAYKIKNLVDGILAYYQAEQAMYEKAELFNLKPFLLSIVEMINVSQEAEIKIPNEEYKIYMNKVALEQILVNLMQNGLKYNDKPNRELNISFTEDDNNYNFVVSDNGNGIEKENQQKIFELFTTLGSRDRFGSMGTGIGLSTVKKLVEKMDGKITVLSEPGIGSVFSFQVKKDSQKSD